MDSRVAGAAMTIEGQATSSVDLEETYIPVLKMLGEVVVVDRAGDCEMRCSDFLKGGSLRAANR